VSGPSAPALRGVPDTFVPVDRRWAGFDKRTIVPSVIVLILAAVFSLVLPRINDSVSYTDQVKAGDVLDLAKGELTFTPTVGWNLVQGVRLTSKASEAGVPSVTQVVLQDISFAIVTGPFTGTPAQLLDQINKVDKKLRDRPNLGSATKRSDIATADGVTGVADFYTGLESQGFNAAFIYQIAGEPVGVEVVVRGSDASLTRNVQQVAAMLRSITYRAPAGS
jgi:hypothetical protein